MRSPSIKLAFTATAGIAALASSYLVGLAVAAATRPQGQGRRPAPPEPPRIATVVPAHNEANTIERTLRSLRAVDYPDDAWQVVVVADNCTDRTAEIAAQQADWVLVREDQQRLGKGYAVQFAFDALLNAEQQPDVIAVVDADCTVSANFAGEIAAQVTAGAEVVQTVNQVANPCASRYSALRYAAFAAVNFTRPAGRDKVGLSAGLLGTGMAFTTNLLERHGWRSFGLAEDAEQHAALILEGHRVHFAAGARVESDMPVSFRDAESQQARWETGRLGLARTWIPRLASRAIRQRDPVAAVAAVDLAIPPLSVAVAGSGLVALGAQAAQAPAARRLALGALAGYAFYVLSSLRAVQAPACVYRALLAAPLLAVWELRVLARALARRTPKRWIRTKRAGAAVDA